MFILAALRALSSIPALEVLRLDPGAVGRVDVVAVRVAAVRGVALAKLGDERALPVLTAAAQEEKIPYLTFIEIRNAIETLGGTCPERNYEDDPEYEALRELDMT